MKILNAGSSSLVMALAGNKADLEAKRSTKPEVNPADNCQNLYLSISTNNCMTRVGCWPREA